MPVSGDLRRALRSLARRRTFAVTAVLTLALAFSIPAVVLSTLDRHFTMVAGGAPTRVDAIMRTFC